MTLAQPKDTRLWQLAEVGNVAQFASFDPGLNLRHARIAGDPDVDSLETAIHELHARASSGTLNIRTFADKPSKSLPFQYEKNLQETLESVREFARQGLYTVINETIDISDGGVSGVALGGIIEFSPDDTPRAVEKSGAASLSYSMALGILHTVYGFEVTLPWRDDVRLEFSVHPHRVGYRRSHVILWEEETVGRTALATMPRWPNRFSSLIGDKVFGLLVANELGLPVPRTTVVSRRVAPFAFGAATGTQDYWMRTAPARQDPGRFTTTPRWVDPFALLAGEDPEGSVASILAQEGVDAEWSGASKPLADGTQLVEGVHGRGLAYMQGDAAPVPLPTGVENDVRRLLQSATAELGPVSSEWAHDGKQVWVLQLHIAQNPDADADTLSPGDATTWLEYVPSEGLDELRKLIERAQHQPDTGIVVLGYIGITSHVGDLLRKAGVPGRRALG